MGVYLPLPSEYQEVEYIQSSGTQYINTGWTPTIYDSIEAKFSTLASTSDTNLYGSRYFSGMGAQADYTIWINTSSGKGIAVHFPYGGGNTQVTDTGWFYTSDIINNAVTLKVTPSNCYVNNEVKYTFNVSRTEYTGTYTAYIFGRNQNGSLSNAGNFKIYYFRIWTNGTLVRDFVPCYRKSDNVIGLYDLVNNQFYTNSGTGTFTKGANITAVPLNNAYIGEVWHPGNNTIAYYPLTSTTTVNDQSGNNRNLTNNGVTFGTYGGISCASFPNANAKRLSGTLPLTGNQAFTISTYIQRLGNSATSTGSQIVVLGNIGSTGGCFGMSIKNSTYTNPNKYTAYTWGTDREATYANTTGRWELATITNDTVNIKLYINGVLQLSTTISFNINSTNFTIGSFPTATSGDGTYQNFYGYMSEFIVENKAWTSQEVTDYYNNTKSDYGL